MKKTKKHYNPLSPQESEVILNKGTEPPYSGEYEGHFANGIYVCRQCEAPLYTSFSKFQSGCGWPSFDDEIAGSITQQLDADGRRTEIICNHCQGHLGHVFIGEQHTATNTRHCVNSLSIKFIDIQTLLTTAKQDDSELGAAIYAGGCFWGVEYHFAKAPGVLATQVGYIGGQTDNPTYEQVCAGDTGHAEALLVIYDKAVTDYTQLTKLFFNLHDPSQVDRQGPDVGKQYRSAIYYLNEAQQQIAQQLISQLQQQLEVATKVIPAATFWPAEDYHQQYYRNKGGQPYCHVFTERFK